MSYRKSYSEYVGVKIPSNWDVHHKDHNRDNNCISNLIALPKFLHRSYHFYESFYSNNEIWRLSMAGKLNKNSCLRMIEVASLINYCSSMINQGLMFKWDMEQLFNDVYINCKEKFDKL